jgi:MFS family permease
LVGFVSGIPTWLFMLFGGVVADRMPRRNLLVITQTAMMILAFILAALTAVGLVQPWHIVLLAFLLGVANAFDAPARMAFVLELVDREDLTNAIALNATMFQTATAVGPAVAGLTYATLGPAWCFTINGISFLAVIAALLRMHVQPLAVRQRATSALHDLAEGLRYVARHSIIRTLIAVIGMVSLFGMAYATLFPAWAVMILHGDATTNGLLQSARGLGALLGALMIASLGRFKFRGKLLTLGTVLFPVLLVVFSAISVLPLALLVLVAVGWAFMIVMNMANTLVQMQVSDELRGRVMAVYSLVFFGFMPIGALWAGTLAQWVGPPLAVVFGAVVAFAFAVGLYIFVPKVRALE